jgi:hypothetical protein
MTTLPSHVAIPSQVAGLTGGIFAAIAVALALFSVILLIPIIIIVANRAEPDQRGLRPQSVYLFGMSFVSLQLTYAGSVLIVTSLLSVVLFGVALLLHLGRGIETARGDGTVAGPNLRVMQSYAAVVGFIYFLQLIFSLGVAVYLVIALIAPSVFGSFGADRKGTLALLLDLVYVMLASAFVVMAHSSIGPSALRARRQPAHVGSAP